MPFKHFPVINYIYCCYLHMACLWVSKHCLGKNTNAHNDTQPTTTDKERRRTRCGEKLSSNFNRKWEMVSHTIRHTRTNTYENGTKTQNMRQLDDQHLFV